MTMYLVLGVAESDTESQIKAAYRSLARKHHPDVAETPNPKKFAAVQQAYNVIGNAVNRKEYDAWLRAFRGQPAFKTAEPQVSQQNQTNAAQPQPTKLKNEADEKKPEPPKQKANGRKGSRLSDWFIGGITGPTTIAWA